MTKYGIKINQTEGTLQKMVAQHIRERMKEVGVTQQPLAEALGIERSTISLYLTGQRKISVFTLVKIAKILNTTVAELLGIEDPNFNQRPVRTKTSPLSLNLQTVPKLNWTLLANSTRWSKILNQQRTIGKDTMEYEKIALVESVSQEQLLNCFAIEMMSDEMMSQFYSPQLIPAGTIMFVDICKLPKNGNIVIVRTNENKLVTGIFTDHGTHATINFLNQAYPPLDVTKVRIEGVIIETRKTWE